MMVKQTASGAVDLTGPVDPMTGNTNLFGTGGVVNTSNTTAVTGNFFAVQAVTEVVLTSLSETGAEGNLNGATLAAGTVLYGRFTGYQLSSGTLRAYKTRTETEN